MAKKKPAAKKTKKKAAAMAVEHDVDDVVARLKRAGRKQVRDGMARYAIPSDRAFGVSVGAIRKIAKELQPNHVLAEELWQTGWYEARMLATFVDDPACVTAAQLERWCTDFDSWAICDTACFALFDRTPFAWKKIPVWARRREEFVRRAAFALLASLTVHDKQADDSQFADGLALIEAAAGDERNFVKKAVNWALRSIGKRSTALHAASVEVAARLAAQSAATPRWIGKHALRELKSPAVLKRLAARKSKQ